jgi:uncharacterized protein YbjT (DUF2867 family)
MILLTSALGADGRATIKAYKAEGEPFEVAMGPAAKTALNAVQTVHFDWDIPGGYLLALHGVEKLLLLAPNSERQVGYVSQAAAAAKRAGVKHIVLLSAFGADAGSSVILGRQHFAVEREIRADGIA